LHADFLSDGVCIFSKNGILLLIKATAGTNAFTATFLSGYSAVYIYFCTVFFLFRRHFDIPPAAALKYLASLLSKAGSILNFGHLWYFGGDFSTILY